MDNGGEEGATPAILPERAYAPLALAIPCLAGLAFLWRFDAPVHFLYVNAAALALGLMWIAFAPRITSPRIAITGALMCLVLLAAPLATGPRLDGIARWLPLGSFQLHAGALAITLLVSLAATCRRTGPLLIVAGGAICALQPDAASALALMCAAGGVFWVTRERSWAVSGALLLTITLFAASRGNLPPQPFVENVLADAASASILAALGLCAALVAGFALIVRCSALQLPVRAALAGGYTGFVIMAMLGDYPSILIGYGAAPIIGFALALGLSAGRASIAEPRREA